MARCETVEGVAWYSSPVHPTSFVRHLRLPARYQPDQLDDQDLIVAVDRVPSVAFADVVVAAAIPISASLGDLTSAWHPCPAELERGVPRTRCGK